MLINTHLWFRSIRNHQPSSHPYCIFGKQHGNKCSKHLGHTALVSHMNSSWNAFYFYIPAYRNCCCSFGSDNRCFDLIWFVRVWRSVFSLLSWLLRHGSHISGCGGFSTETQKGLPLMKCQALSVIAQYRPLRNASKFHMPCTGFDNKLNSFWYCDLCSNSYFSFHFFSGNNCKEWSKYWTIKKIWFV